MRISGRIGFFDYYLLLAICGLRFATGDIGDWEIPGIYVLNEWMKGLDFVVWRASFEILRVGVRVHLLWRF